MSAWTTFCCYDCKPNKNKNKVKCLIFGVFTVPDWTVSVLGAFAGQKGVIVLTVFLHFFHDSNGAVWAVQDAFTKHINCQRKMESSWPKNWIKHPNPGTGDQFGKVKAFYEFSKPTLSTWIWMVYTVFFPISFPFFFVPFMNKKCSEGQQ